MMIDTTKRKTESAIRVRNLIGLGCFVKWWLFGCLVGFCAVHPANCKQLINLGFKPFSWKYVNGGFVSAS